jgi:osmotically-inducible protein OsmY
VRASPASLVLIALLALALVGCQTLTGETLGENIDDTNVTAVVKTKLAQEKGVMLTQIHVSTIKRTVYLTGTVATAALKDRAGAIARGVSGVREVVNNLRVGP